MQVAILGPVEVTIDGRNVDPGASKERAVLAMLSLRAGRSVSVDALVEAIWGEEPPPTARKTLQSHISRLRSVLGEEAIRTEGKGYVLDVEEDDVDVLRLEQLVGLGREALIARDATDARRRFTDAEALWRGDPLADLADAPLRWGRVSRLHELRRQARSGRIEASLALGEHERLVGELEQMVAEDVLHEPSWGQLMLALYRSGRQADALHAYRRLRKALADELGVEPSPKLQRLEWQILSQDPQLELQPPLPRSELPAPVSSFVGRTAEVAAVAAAVRDNRLVTLHGPGGVGKTRLGLEAARQLTRDFTDGIWWVDVTPAMDAADVVARITEVLRAPSNPAATPLDSLIGFVRRREMLVVLDNLEHVAQSAAAAVTSILRAAPAVRIMTTSRVTLGAEGELAYPVAPLGLPVPTADPETIPESESVTLFEERRSGTGRPDVERNDLADVAALVARLDGLPLAIELAAARAAHLTPAEIIARLDEHMVLLGVDTATMKPAHHRTIGATIDWSYDDLDGPTQHLFDRLAVFPDDFDVAAAEAVGASDDVRRPDVLEHLARLVDASMVVTRPIGDTQRYRLLVVLREYGSQCLADRGEEADARRAHADHFREFALAAGREVNGPDAGWWSGAVIRDFPNIRAAVTWSIGNDHPASTLQFARLLATEAGNGWGSGDARASIEQARKMLEGADDAPPDLRGWAWLGMVIPGFLAGELELALDASDRALTLFAEAGDLAGAATTQWQLGAALLLGAGDTQGATTLLSAAVDAASRAGLPNLEAWATAQLAQSMLFGGAPLEPIEPLLRSSETLADEGLGVLQAHLAMNRCYYNFRAGALAAGERDALQGHSLGRAAEAPTYEQIGLVALGFLVSLRSALDEARTHLLRAALLAIDAGNELQLGIAMQVLASIADIEGQPARAARLWGAGTRSTPVWPVFEEWWFPGRAREALGERFEAEVAAGRGLSTRQVLDLAIG